MGLSDLDSGSSSPIQDLLSQLARAVNIGEFNKKTSGGSFTDDERSAVWNKAYILPGELPNVYRQDTCGARICWYDYGNTSRSTGWEIDHINPISNGGTDSVVNLQPLQWENNRFKADKLHLYYCIVPGKG
jgi:hypothetical protein